MAKSGFRLGAVLRARKAQEDAAKAAVVRARNDAATAHSAVRARNDDLDRRRAPDAATSAAFAATLSARQAIASALSAAVGVAQLADDTVKERLDDLTDAAVQRRTIEKLQERHDLTRKRTEAAAEAKAVDDLTTAAAFPRKGTT
jgi:flagellar export protein FliJ